MIDWITCKIPCFHRKILTGGEIVNVSPTGEIEYVINKKLSVEGSYSSKVAVRSCDFSREHGHGTIIEVSGNPVKFLQGHNIFGTDDLLNLNFSFMEKLTTILELEPTWDDFIAWRDGLYTLSRVDINYMFQLENLMQVQAWLRAAELKSRTRQGRPAMKGGSLYFNDGSKRWGFVFYSKGEEIAVKGRLPEELKSNKQLTEWTQNKLRAELRLRYRELDTLLLTRAKNWRTLKPRDLHRIYMERINMTDQVALPGLIEQSLPPRLRTAYLSWKAGTDLKDIYSRPTYYRYRKQLLEYGIDIAILQEKEPDNVIPLVQVLEAQPVSTPDFAIGTDLYFQPRKVAF